MAVMNEKQKLAKKQRLYFTGLVSLCALVVLIVSFMSAIIEGQYGVLGSIAFNGGCSALIVSAFVVRYLIKRQKGLTPK